jgi:nitroimidazol reductase NimA-like FMN-containing flavoprotein (pyridoxamine 5'-phosphate oxidase superfamily)
VRWTERVHSSPQAATSTLSETQCWKLLGSAQIGILAVVTEDGPDLFPIDFLAAEHSVVFRTAPGEKLMKLAADPRVALAVEGEDAKGLWSVVLRGTARRLSFDDEIEASGVLSLETATGGTKANFVRITATQLTGRRIARV